MRRRRRASPSNPKPAIANLDVRQPHIAPVTRPQGLAHGKSVEHPGQHLQGHAVPFQIFQSLAQKIGGRPVYGPLAAGLHLPGPGNDAMGTLVYTGPDVVIPQDILVQLVITAASPLQDPVFHRGQHERRQPPARDITAVA